jgi:putative FmdB family regulatory protein
MPIFEYRCSACGHKFEDVRPSSEADQVKECPHCGRPKVERQVSPFACGCGTGPSWGGGGSGRRSG